MPTKHITQQIEAYLDHDLPIAESRRIEEHLAHCPTCAHRLFEARRLSNELGRVMQKKLGHPSPPPALRHQLRQQLKNNSAPRRFRFPWTASGRFLNAIGTFTVMAVLLLAAYAVIRGQLPNATTQERVSSGQEDQPDNVALIEPTLIAEADTKPSTEPPITSLGDSLTMPVRTGDKKEAILPQPQVSSSAENTTNPAQKTSNVESSVPAENEFRGPTSGPPLSKGVIAFSFFNSGAQFYEIHLVNPDGSNRRRFPVDGISEPALRRADNGDHQIAYRTWGEPTTPRALISNDLVNNKPDTLTHFWEDGHPDWSPTEPRLIFASQRESDRRWRLYTIWGDGSAEVDLRREGRSPTFAPDGSRFAFVGCEEPLNKIGCGLLVGDLDTIEQEADLILEDGLVESPDWSPTEEKIAYMANPGGNWDLYVVNSSGGPPRRLTDDPAIDGLPVWSPNGEWLAFLSNRSGKWAIWALHVASGHSQLVVDFNEGDFMSPSAGPPYGERDWQDEQLSWAE